MGGIIAGLVESAAAASELGEELGNYGRVSIISNKTPAADGPFKGVPIEDLPQTLMSYGADEDNANYFYEEIGQEYAFVAVEVEDKDIETVKSLFSEWDATNIQYFYK